MELKFSMNKRLVVLVLDEINEKNLPINCTVGKTSKKIVCVHDRRNIQF